jgi:hypothetical protein
MDSVQRVELNCGRIEARAIDAFDVYSQQVCFPYANKAAMLMQRTDPGKDGRRQLNFPAALTQLFGCRVPTVASSDCYRQSGGGNGENWQGSKR